MSKFTINDLKTAIETQNSEKLNIIFESKEFEINKFTWCKQLIDFIKNETENNPDAQNLLGYCYHHGIGLEKDDDLAFYYYKLAAESGNSPAENNLGFSYQHGIGIEKNEKLAYHYYKLAAESGNSHAENNLNKLKKCPDFINWLLTDYENDKNKIKELEQEKLELKQENLELKLRPPEKGGPEYEKAYQRFTNQEYE